MRKYAVITLLLVFSSPGHSQLWKIRRLEIAAGAGTSHFFGDIGGFSRPDNYLGFRDVSLLNTGLGFQSRIRYNLTENLSVRFNAAVGYFHSDDRRGLNQDRAYESATTFFEPSVSAEFYILKNRMENRYLFIRGHRTTRYPLSDYFDYYIFGGIGGMAWEVTPNPNLAFRLKSANGFSMVIPAGIGISRSYPRNFKTGIELGGRYVLSDLPDGYSGQGSRKDIYYLLSFNAAWKLRTRQAPIF